MCVCVGGGGFRRKILRLLQLNVNKVAQKLLSVILYYITHKDFKFFGQELFFNSK